MTTMAQMSESNVGPSSHGEKGSDLTGHKLTNGGSMAQVLPKEAIEFFGRMPDVERDAIFELTKRYRAAHADFLAGKLAQKPINLGIGAYADKSGNTPMMPTVAAVLRTIAEEKIAGATETKGLYLPILGFGPFIQGTENVVFGDALAQDLRANSRLLSCQALGGTGGCFLQGAVLARAGAKSIYVSTPTWGNHLKIYGMTGLSVEKYPFFNSTTSSVEQGKMLSFLSTLAAGTPVSLHACCHNPTGAQLSGGEWEELSDLFAQKGLVAVFDAAYAGFGESFDLDMQGVRTFASKGIPMLLSFSYSKIASLYDERVGAMSIVLPESPNGSNAQLLERVKGNLEAAIRACYSNPPGTFTRVMGRILNDPKLRTGWESDRQSIADEIFHGGVLLADCFEAKGIPSGNLRQRGGMFSMLPFSPEQVQAIETDQRVFMLGNGRINRGAVNETNAQEIANRVYEIWNR